MRLERIYRKNVEIQWFSYRFNSGSTYDGSFAFNSYGVLDRPLGLHAPNISYCIVDAKTRNKPSRRSHGGENTDYLVYHRIGDSEVFGEVLTPAPSTLDELQGAMT